MRNINKSYTLERTTSISFLIVLAFILFNNLYAQTNKLEIKPLEIGENIPDELWNLSLNVVNDPTGNKETTLKNYKGKLILLDFWGTYCSSCIAAFPQIHKVEEENADKVKILAVSHENREKLIKFFSSEVGQKYKYIHSIYEDKILHKYFPHYGVPFIIWITPDGKFFSSTNTYEITNEKIDQALKNKRKNILTKIPIDPKKPLMLSDNFYINNNLKLGFYSIFFQGYYPGIGSGGKFKTTPSGKAYGRQFTNLKLIQIVRALGRHLFEERNEHFTDKRIIMETLNPYLTEAFQPSSDKRSNDQYYSYELIVPEEKSNSLYTHMLDDLKRYLDVNLSLRKVNIDCLVLVKTSNNDKIKSKGDPSKRNFSESSGKLTIANEPLVNLISLLNEIPLSNLPIIDETGYKNNIDLDLTGANSLGDLRKSLSQYDLDLKTQTKELLMFIIEDKK